MGPALTPVLIVIEHSSTRQRTLQPMQVGPALMRVLMFISQSFDPSANVTAGAGRASLDAGLDLHRVILGQRRSLNAAALAERPSLDAGLDRHVGSSEWW
jgi:hypothetical protein